MLIQKIRNSLLLQLICIVLAILTVLSVTLYTSYIYVKDTTITYTETLADSLLDENRRMIEEIRDGKIRLYETELAQQKMEILAYRNQINPHFLYNTLSCMRDMSLFHGQDDIAEMAMALSDIFRYAVKASNIVTVRDEVSYIAKYARIIEYRFMGKIMISTSAKPSFVIECLYVFKRRQSHA